MKYITFSFLLTLSLSVLAQQNEGIIVYKQTTNVHKMMGDRATQYKDMIPEFRSTNMELRFKDTETIYQTAKKQEVVENEGGRGGRGFRMRMMGGGGGSSMTYRNLEANTSTESSEFMGKKFLIRGEFEDQEWKMSGETKMINDMMCMKATTIDSVESRTMFGGRGRGPGGSQSEGEKENEERKERPTTKEARKITAWFTPTIPVQAGPGNFGNLPGLILELDIDDGNTTYTIESLELNTLEEAIAEPTKGKEVTREEYRKIVREKMKEMREEGGGNGFRVIRG